MSPRDCMDITSTDMEAKVVKSTEALLVSWQRSVFSKWEGSNE